MVRGLRGRKHSQRYHCGNHGPKAHRQVKPIGIHIQIQGAIWENQLRA
jgi:hypothetical protein